MATFGELSDITLLPTGEAAESIRVLDRRSGQEGLALLDAGDRRFRRQPERSRFEFDDSFRLFNLAAGAESGTAVFVDPHQSVPNIAGTDDEPDVITKINLTAFHPGRQIEKEIGKDARATLRLDIGQDELSDSPLEPLFWSIAAGLDLSNTARNKESPNKYRSDFDQAFARRPIEVAGGLAEVRFEVFAHEEKPWWQKIFSALGSSSATSLINALGFPGIVNEAIDVVNEAFDKFDKNTKPLFKSAKMTFALSERARQSYTLGMPGIHIGVLPHGFTLMVPQRHYDLIRKTRPYFLGAYGKLVPGEVSVDEFNAPDYQDPYAEIPYALLKVQSRAAALQAF